jgi:hypothetical protein
LLTIGLFCKGRLLPVNIKLSYVKQSSLLITAVKSFIGRGIKFKLFLGEENVKKKIFKLEGEENENVNTISILEES